MKGSIPRDSTSLNNSRQSPRSRWLWLLVIASAAVILIGLLRRPGQDEQAIGSNPAERPSANAAAKSPIVGRPRRPPPRSSSADASARAAEEIVANKLTQFARSRRELAHALAGRHGVEVSDDVERFFDAVGSGNWDEIEAQFKLINGGDSSAGHATGRPPGVEHLWPAIIDAYGAAEQAHLWPAQKLLDYGNAVLGALRPRMVYVGGTDNGRWIPELLNDTSDGERHMILTQNGLADGTYLDYLSLLYGDRMAALTEQDSQLAFQEYMADAQKRLQHDQQFPDEPKQIRAGENIRSTEGRIDVSGMVAVMAINEKLLQTLMQKNPDVSFALQESHPLKSTYENAVPLGPIMELRAEGGPSAFTPERAGQSLDYWRTTTQQLLSDPVASGSSETLKSHSHDAAAAANLLAAHNYIAEAEQAFRLSSQLASSNIEAVTGLSELFVRTGRVEEARQLLEEFARHHPDQRSAVETFRGSFLFTTPATTQEEVKGP